MSRFIICYQGASDPSSQEERNLVSSLKSVKVIEKMRGTLLVDGPEAEVASAVGRLTQWTFTPERSVRVKPPHKRIKQPA